MAQITSSTSSVTGTDGTVQTNRPIVVENVLRAEPVEIYIENSEDLNLYPAVSIQTVTASVQYWIYDLGDTATRDADLAVF